MKTLLRQNARLIDCLNDYLESRIVLAKVSTFLIFIYILSILLIEANNRGIIRGDLHLLIPTTHLVAIELVFTILLMYEALGLLLSIAESITMSVGKQFEILSLILLRNTFKTVSHFPEPITWKGIEGFIPDMGISILAAVILYFLTQIFYKISKRHNITRSSNELEGYIGVKKLMTTFMLIGFITIIFTNGYERLVLGESEDIFGIFYTMLIFFDIMMVLVSLRYQSGYRISFRNSAYAVSTVIIKMALIAPPLFAAGLGVFAMLIAISTSWTYSRFKPAS